MLHWKPYFIYSHKSNFIHILYIFCLIWLIFGAKGVHENLFCACEFCANQYVGSYGLLVHIHEFLPHFPHSLSHLGEIRYNAVKHLWVQWKLVQVRLYFSYWHKWTYIQLCVHHGTVWYSESKEYLGQTLFTTSQTLFVIFVKCPWLLRLSTLLCVVSFFTDILDIYSPSSSGHTLSDKR